MLKTNLEYPIQSLQGKISKKADLVIVQNSQTGQHYTRIWKGRNFDAHPVTDGEVRVHNRMKEAVAAYRALKNDPVAYGEFMALYNQEMESLAATLQSTPDAEQRESSGTFRRPSLYHFFISRYLDEGKHSDMLRLAHESTSVESYTEAVRQCPDRESADRVIIDFLRTMGFSSLADAYQQKL